MGRKFKFRNQNQPYFVTCTVVHWLNVFEEGRYFDILIGSINHCQTQKGLIIYGWCFMPNHIHMIIGTRDKPLQDIIRDFKSYTSRHIRKAMVKDQQDPNVSKLLHVMNQIGLQNSNNKDWQLWQQHNHPIEIFSSKIAEQKLNYIHINPVKAGLAEKPTDWVYSSAKDYDGQQGLLEIEFLR